MGVFDFVKSKEMMIARPDNLKYLIVYKHPDQNIPMYSQLTVDSDEVAVFFKDGRVMGVLPPGRHTMQSQNIPFLNNLVTSFTGGNVFIAEVFFVTTRPVRDITFGGPAGDILDPMTGEEIPLRIFGEMAVAVRDPVLFVTGYVGQQSAAGDNNQILDWIKGKFMNSVVTVLTQVCEDAQKSINQVIGNRDAIAAAFMSKAPALNQIGLVIVDMGKIEPNISWRAPPSSRRRSVRRRSSRSASQAPRPTRKPRSSRSTRSSSRTPATCSSSPATTKTTPPARRSSAQGRGWRRTASAAAASRAWARRWRSASAWATR